jgi:predicted transcriptional regulator
MADPDLPDAELDVMLCLWSKGPQTAAAIREMLAAGRPMTHASVSTLLGRLTHKGLVTREKGTVGKAFVFRATVERNPIQRQLVGDLLDRVFGGSGIALISTLLESRRPSARELDELSTLVHELRSRKSRSASGTARSKRKEEGAN